MYNDLRNLKEEISKLKDAAREAICYGDLQLSTFKVANYITRSHNILETVADFLQQQIELAEQEEIQRLGYSTSVKPVNPLTPLQVKQGVENE